MEAGSALFSKSRSEVTYRKDQNSFPKPKVKAKSVIEFNPKFSSQNQSLQYHQQSYQQPYNQFPPQFPSQLPLQHNEGYYNNNNSQYNQFNSRFITNSSSNTSHRAWSDVTYRPYDVHTELTNFSDPGPQVQKQPFNFSPRAPPIATIYENDHNYYLNQQQPSLYDEARSPKPKIAASAMMDIGNNAVQSGTTTMAKSRKVILSAQLNNTDNFTDQDYPDPNDDSDNHKEDYNEEVDNDDDDNVPNDDFGSNDNGNDQAEFDELMNMSSDPRIQRKLLDLQISNKSLLALNDKLETTVKEQSDKLAIIPSFETMMETQQKQLEHLNKVKELICTLSAKITDQDDEIKIIKNQIVKKSDEKEKEKTRATLFYDPKSLPLNSLPNIIFDRAYDDITILFSVVTSLLYTVYIFPFIVIAKTAKQLVDKSRDRIQEVKIVTNN